jgi:hypothetical protein
MGGGSIYGSKFPEKNFIKNPTQPRILLMKNADKNTNGIPVGMVWFSSEQRSRGWATGIFLRQNQDAKL